MENMQPFFINLRVNIKAYDLEGEGMAGIRVARTKLIDAEVGFPIEASFLMPYRIGGKGRLLHLSG